MSHPYKKIRKFYGVLKGAKMTEHKESLLEGYNAVSLNDLTGEQLDELIVTLDEMQDTAPRRKAMSTNIHLLEELGVYVKPNPWPRVNNFVKHARIGGKEMFRMSAAELNKLSSKLRAILAKKKEKEQTDADINRLLTAVSDELDNEE